MDCFEEGIITCQEKTLQAKEEMNKKIKDLKLVDEFIKESRITDELEDNFIKSKIFKI